MGKKEQKRGQVSPLKKKGTRKKYGETVWKSRMTPSVAVNCINRGKRCRGSYERSKDCPLLQRKCKRTSWSHCKHQLQEVEKKRNDLVPEHPKGAESGLKRCKASRTRENMQKESLAAREELRKIKEEIDWKEERFRLLSDKVEKHRMADAEMEAEFQELQAGEARRGSNASQTGDSCLQALWQQIAAVCAAVGPNQVDVLANAVFQRFKESGAAQEQMPRRDERRRNSEEKQEQGRASQQAALPTPGGVNQVAPASSLELDLPRVRGVPGEGGSAGRPCKRGPSRSPGRPSGDEEGDDGLGVWCRKPKRNKKKVRDRTQEPWK